MTPSGDRPLTIWAVSDGRVGIEAQVLGLAEAVARQRPATIVTKRVSWRPGFRRFPMSWALPPRLALSGLDGIRPPWPDIWIAAGRASLPVSNRMRRWSHGHTFVVQTQNPRMPLTGFDLVIPPVHDGLAGDKVLPIIGAPTRLWPAGLQAALGRFPERIAPLPHPRVAIVIGGASKTHDLPPGRAVEMADEIVEAVSRAGGSLLVSFTRRTPEAARKILTERLSALPGWIWDGEGENPYFTMLAAADLVLVTEDSTNLATDAATSGKPVHVLTLPGGNARFDRFHADLRERGVTRPFDGQLRTWSYPALDETNRAASELLRRYDLRRNS